MTFGQFVKAIASFLAPYIAMWGATCAIPQFGLSWRVLFPIYMIVAIIAILWLSATPIEEEKPDKASGFVDCLKLLGNPFIILCFLGIMCHVGIDVGTNTTAPKILMERLGMTLDEASFATSMYFIFRTIGCFSGAIILQKVSSKLFFIISVIRCPICHLYSHRFDRFRQLECLFHRVLTGIAFIAREEERDFRSDDYGTFRRYGLPVADGFCQRCHGTGRCGCRNDDRSYLFTFLYLENQTLII